MGFSQAPALPYRNLGIAQDGDAASQAISKGKYIIWKGKNYFAKTDILQGETFVEDTNLTEIPDGALNGIADALNASITSPERIQMTLTAGSHWTNLGGCWYRKMGDIVEINIAIVLSNQSNVFILPEGDRPPTEIYFTGSGGEGPTQRAAMNITTDGKIRITPGSGYACVHGMYIV